MSFDIRMFPVPMKDDFETRDSRSYPRYYKWVNGVQMINEDGTTEFLTEWPEAESYPGRQP